MGTAVKYMTLEQEAVTRMPYTALSREEIRLVSCPKCGAEATSMCWHPNKQDRGVHRRQSRIHRARILKAKEYRSEGRI